MLTLNPVGFVSRGTLADIWKHPWVKMGQEPLLPLCEEDSGVTAGMILGSRWDQSLHLKGPKVGFQTIIVRPSLIFQEPQQLRTPASKP